MSDWVRSVRPYDPEKRTEADKHKPIDQGSKAMKDMLQELGYMEGEGDL